MNCRTCFLLLIAVFGWGAWAQDKEMPATPPAQQCEYDGSRGNESLRIVDGADDARFFFSCHTGNPNAGPTGCIESTLPVGLVISVDREDEKWACIHSEGRLSGWMPADRLGPLPTAPAPPVDEWIGWWRRSSDSPGRKNSRILITRGKDDHVLHVSGRAYWYGLNQSVNFGQVKAEAVPVGRYLHVVEKPDGGCVVDLQLTRDERGAKLQVKDNEGCGGMNVRFMGEWRKFNPARVSTRR